MERLTDRQSGLCYVIIAPQKSKLTCVVMVEHQQHDMVLKKGQKNDGFKFCETFSTKGRVKTKSHLDER